MTINDKYREIIFKLIIGILKRQPTQGNSHQQAIKKSSEAALNRCGRPPLTNAVQFTAGGSTRAHIDHLKRGKR